jgi:hypothetical protein
MMNPKKHKARQPRSPNSRDRLLEYNFNDNDSQSTTIKILKNHDDAVLQKNVSSLHPDSIRWINRRKPKKTGNKSVPGQVLPSKALQLREVFKSLDTDNTGVINLKTLKHALRYVNQGNLGIAVSSPISNLNASTSLASSTTNTTANGGSSAAISHSHKSSTSSPSISPPGTRHGHFGDGKLLRDPQGLLDFFASMDTNHDGIVDFNDFLVAMTANPDENDATGQPQQIQTIGNGLTGITNPQDEFFDFATKHRRQKILEFVKLYENNDIEKYHEIKKLFQLSYIPASNTTDLSVTDKLNRIKNELQNRMKELHSEQFVLKRKKEILRAREATLFFEQKHHQYLEQQPSSQHSQIKSFHKKQDQEETEKIANEIDLYQHEQVEKQIRKRFSQFALHNQHTYTPVLNDVLDSKKKNSTHYFTLAKEEAYKMKNDKYLVKNIPPILPPISLKERISQKTASVSTSAVG